MITKPQNGTLGNYENEVAVLTISINLDNGDSGDKQLAPPPQQRKSPEEGERQCSHARATQGRAERGGAPPPRSAQSRPEAAQAGER